MPRRDAIAAAIALVPDDAGTCYDAKIRSNAACVSWTKKKLATLIPAG
jgi:hypothetical protein